MNTLRFPVSLGIASLSVVCAASLNAADLVAHWTLNQNAPPYTDSSPNGLALTQDAATTPALSVGGIAGSGAQLNWQPTPGVSTRLSATDPRLQTDSFGFSFWFNPVFLDGFNNLLGKEMAFNNTAAGWARMAWQVQLGGDNNGFAPIEFVVRGDNRAAGDFFGNVFSSATLALRSDTPDWIHVAGGYDSITGALSLFVNGAGSVSGNSSPGAHNSDGSPFAIGTARNGSDFVSFAAGAVIDDVQLYKAPLTAAEVDFLRANPGLSLVPEPGSLSLILLGAAFALRFRRA